MVQDFVHPQCGVNISCTSRVLCCFLEGGAELAARASPAEPSVAERLRDGCQAALQPGPQPASNRKVRVSLLSPLRKTTETTEEPKFV